MILQRLNLLNKYLVYVQRTGCISFPFQPELLVNKVSKICFPSKMRTSGLTQTPSPAAGQWPLVSCNPSIAQAERWRNGTTWGSSSSMALVCPGASGTWSSFARVWYLFQKFRFADNSPEDDFVEELLWPVWMHQALGAVLKILVSSL